MDKILIVTMITRAYRLQYILRLFGGLYIVMLLSSLYYIVDIGS